MENDPEMLKELDAQGREGGHGGFAGKMAFGTGLIALGAGRRPRPHECLPSRAAEPGARRFSKQGAHTVAIAYDTRKIPTSLR